MSEGKVSCRRRVLVTGATGNIGAKLSRHLDAAGRFELVRLCLNPSREPGVVTADLSVPDAGWTDRLAGVDTVVHLAGNPRNQAGWEGLIAPNIDALLHVYLAALRHRVRRVVFASSVWSLFGYRFTRDRLAPELTACPSNPYGATKLFGERVGQAFYDQHGIEGIAFRIGACQRHDNRPHAGMIRGAWQQGCWLSDRDCCQGLERAIEAPDVGFAVLNLTSEIEGGRWDLSETRRLLGYAPQDQHAVAVRPLRRLQAGAARLAHELAPAALRRLVPASW